MPRSLRFAPPGALVEVMTRTIHGRPLLRPSRDVNDIAIGILARAARRYDVGICDFEVLSNHYHLLLRPPDAVGLAGFMNYLNGNLAKEVGRLHGWRECFWGRRYHSMVISDEPEAQETRLRYLLNQACKVGLRSPTHWPGATGVHSLLSGEPVSGLWFNRTAEFEARRRGESFGKYDHATSETLHLVPLPCWDDLPAAEIRDRAAQIVAEIERNARAELERSGRPPMSRRRILNQDPQERPGHFERSPAPRLYAVTLPVRKHLEATYRAFVGAYRQAAESLRTAAQAVAFPEGAFPPLPLLPSPRAGPSSPT